MAYSFVQQASNSVIQTSATSSISTTMTPNTGDLLIVAVATNHANDITTFSISDTVNTYNFIGYWANVSSVTFESAPSGATSGTLNATWGGANGTFPIVFSDGEVRYAAISGTSVSWTGALGTVTTAAHVEYYANTVGVFYAQNCVGGALTFTATETFGNNAYGIYVAEYSGIAQNNAFVCVANPMPGTTLGPGSYQPGPGVGANTVSTQATTGVGSSQQIMMWGIGYDETSLTYALTAGTGFTARTAVWATYLGANALTPEDGAATGNTAATWACNSGDGSHTFYSFGAAFALATSSSSQPLLDLGVAKLAPLAWVIRRRQQRARELRRWKRNSISGLILPDYERAA